MLNFENNICAYCIHKWTFNDHYTILGILKFQCKTWESHAMSWSVNIHLSRLAQVVPLHIWQYYLLEFLTGDMGNIPWVGIIFTKAVRQYNHICWMDEIFFISFSSVSIKLGCWEAVKWRLHAVECHTVMSWILAEFELIQSFLATRMFLLTFSTSRCQMKRVCNKFHQNTHQNSPSPYRSLVSETCFPDHNAIFFRLCGIITVKSSGDTW